MIRESVIQMIGNTPLVKFPSEEGRGEVYLKIEGKNPGGSVKDRAVLGMVLAAERAGEIQKGDTLIEATSGSTGIALSMIGRGKGYCVIIVMPESMSEERKQLMRAYGAELILTGEGGMATAVQEAERLTRDEGYFMIRQFENEANAQAHYNTTGPEIYSELPEVTAFVAGIGTGGTVTGVGKYLKEQNPEIQIFGLEPKDSPLLNEGTSGPHAIQGIGANFIPSILDQEILDGVLMATTEDAVELARLLRDKMGILTGFSGGANLWGALELAKTLGEDSVVVTVLPDQGERYLSTMLYDE